jgi:hypothetical protein
MRSCLALGDVEPLYSHRSQRTVLLLLFIQKMPKTQADQPFVTDPYKPSGLLVLDNEQANLHERPIQGDIEHVTNNTLPNRSQGSDVITERSQHSQILDEFARLRPEFILKMLYTWNKKLRSSTYPHSWWPALRRFDQANSLGKLLCAISSPRLILAALCKATVTILMACPCTDLLDDLAAWSGEITGLESQIFHANAVGNQAVTGIFKLLRPYVARKQQTSGIKSIHTKSARTPSIGSIPSIHSADATATVSECRVDSSATIPETASQDRSGPEEKLLARNKSALIDQTVSKLKRGRTDDHNTSADVDFAVPATGEMENNCSFKRQKISFPDFLSLTVTEKLSHIPCVHLRLILNEWVHALIRSKSSRSRTETPVWWPGNVAFQTPDILSFSGK